MQYGRSFRLRDFPSGQTRSELLLWRHMTAVSNHSILRFTRFVHIRARSRLLHVSGSFSRAVRSSSVRRFTFRIHILSDAFRRFMVHQRIPSDMSSRLSRLRSTAPLTTLQFSQTRTSSFLPVTSTDSLSPFRWICLLSRFLSFQISLRDVYTN